MAICGYVVLSKPGAAPVLAGRLAALPGCEVVTAPGRDVLLLVTDSAAAGDDASLRERIERTAGVAALFLTFGAVAPPAPARDPVGER
jgi:nitrate reductase NapAB chaperone NapD